MKKSRIPLLFFLMIACFQTTAMVSSINQVKDTNTVIILNKQAFRERMTQPEQTLTDADKALSIAETLGYQAGIGESYRMSGLGYYYLQQPSKAIAAYNEALNWFVKIKDAMGQAKVCNNFGNLYASDNSDLSFKYFRKGLLIAEGLNDKPMIASLDLSIGNFYYRKSNLFLALKFYKKSERLFLALKDSTNLTFSSEAIGVNYFTLKQFDKAESSLTAARKNAKQLESDGTVESIDLTLTCVYLAENKYAKAEQTIQEGMLLSVSLQDKKLTQDFKQEFAAIPKTNQRTSLKSDEGIRNIILYTQLNDRIVGSENTILKENQASRMAAVKFVNEQKKHRSEILAKNATIRRHYLVAVCFSVLLTILLVIGFLSYRQYQLNKMLELEKMRMTIAADFHDELGSTLSSIALYSEMVLTDDFGDKQRTKSILSMISESARGTVTAMQDMIWTIQPKNDSMLEVIHRMRDYAYPMAELKNIQLSFDIGENVPALVLPMDTRKNAWLVFKEALNNAFKYASASHIGVQLAQHNDMLEMSVKDDGKGFEPAGPRKGNGLANMHKRAELAGGSLLIKSVAGAGTAVIFRCPVQ
jgi:signal transduction histidine kinase